MYSSAVSSARYVQWACLCTVSMEISSAWPPEYATVLHISIWGMRKELVQVLHYGGNHWLTVSTIGCPPFYTVKVYDSLYSDLPTQMKEQICALCLLFKHSVMRAHLEEDVKPFPCKTVNRTQQKNRQNCNILQVPNTGGREDGILLCTSS